MNDQTLPISRITPAAPVVDAELSASGVSWGAIIGGAFVAASAALILTVLGVGLGLSSISPWTMREHPQRPSERQPSSG